MPAMAKNLIVACCSLLVLLGACKKSEPVKATSPGGTPMDRRPTPPIPPPPSSLAPSAAEAKLLLTEDKVSRFITYQKEMVAATADATGLGLAAYQKGGADQKKFENAMAHDDRATKVAAAGKAALEKSGLAQDEMTRLSRVLMPYYARIAALQDSGKKSEEVQAKIDEAKRQGKEPSPVDTAMAKVFSDQKARVDSIRKEFSTKYGEDGLALVQKHEADYLPIHAKMMSAAMGAMMHKPPLPPLPQH
jgi:hypothetical protein